MSPPRPPRGEVSNRGRSSRKAAEKAWKKELDTAERRGARRVRDRLLSLREENHSVIDGIDYVEWSVIVSALEEEVSPLADPTARPAREHPGDEADRGPTATSA